MTSHGFFRIHQIVGTRDNPGLIPISKSAWWAGVKAGKYPPSVKLGPKTTVWRKKDIDSLLAQFDVENHPASLKDKVS